MDMGSKLKTCSPDARVTESNESYILQNNNAVTTKEKIEYVKQYIMMNLVLPQMET